MIKGRGRRRLPPATLRRLCALYGHLEDLSAEEGSRATSFELAADLEVGQLKRLLEEEAGLGRTVRVCVVGLNWLGQALVSGDGTGLDAFRIVAGFDSNTNRLETTRSPMPLYPTYDIEEVVRRESVEIALLTAVPQPAGEILARLARGGVKGVLNLTGRSLGPAVSGLVCNSVAVLDELRFLSVMLYLHEGEET